MAKSRKRKRRKKEDKITNKSTKGQEDKAAAATSMGGNGDHSLCTVPQSGPHERTSTIMSNHRSQTVSAAHCGNESSVAGGTFQLFVHLEGVDSGEEDTSTSEREQQNLNNRHRDKMRLKQDKQRRQALRGGSAQHCHERVRKGGGGLTDLQASKPSSNTNPASNDISEQSTCSERRNRRLRERVLGRTPAHEFDSDCMEKCTDVASERLPVEGVNTDHVMHKMDKTDTYWCENTYTSQHKRSVTSSKACVNTPSKRRAVQCGKVRRATQVRLLM